MEDKIKKIDLFSISLGCIIGFGAFILPGKLFIPLGIKETIFAFSIMPFLFIPIILSYHIMLKKYPNNAGGEFYYILKEYGDFHGFLSAFILTLSYICIIALNSLNLSFTIEVAFPGMKAFYANLISFFIIVLILLSYLKNIHHSIRFQTLLSLYLFLSIFIVFLVFAFDKNINKENYIVSFNKDFNSLNFMRILSIAPLSFIGFDTVVQMSSRTNNVSRAPTIISVFIGAFIYIVLAFVTSIGFNAQNIGDARWPLGETLSNFLGKASMYFIIFAFFIAIISGINGFLLATTELISSLSENNILHKILKKKNKNNSYHFSLIFVCFILVILMLLGRDNVIILIDAASIGISVIYFYMSIISFKYNKFISILSVLSSLFFLFLMVLPIFDKNISGVSPVSYIIFIVWFVITIIAYFIKNKLNKSKNS